MTEPNTDIETLRRPRTQKLIDWLSSPLKRITHVGWRPTIAIVVACRNNSAGGDGIEGPPFLNDYIVEFSYQVGGITYTGVHDSPVEVRPNDSFEIRYNPASPEENNSLGSTGASGAQIGALMTWSFVLLVVVALLMTWFHHGRPSLPSIHDLTE